jgi:hypothetical protein
MGAMESTSRYPDLTRLGISAGAAEEPGLITIIRAKCAATGAEEEAGLAHGGRTLSTQLVIPTASLLAEIQVKPKLVQVLLFQAGAEEEVGLRRAPEDRVALFLPSALDREQSPNIVLS